MHDVAPVPRVDREDAVGLLDRLQPVDALEEESERAGRVSLEGGGPERRVPEIDALAEQPVVRGEGVRPLAGPDRLEASPGPGQLPEERLRLEARVERPGHEPLAVVERPLARGRRRRMERNAAPARQALERLEVVALSRHRFQEIEHEERRDPGAPALRVHPRVGQDDATRSGSDGQREAHPLERPRRVREREPRQLAALGVEQDRVLAGRRREAALDHPGNDREGEVHAERDAQLADEHPAGRRRRSRRRRRVERRLEQRPELLERHGGVHGAELPEPPERAQRQLGLRRRPDEPAEGAQ